jgi:SpoIID/LytB domain protein
VSNRASSIARVFACSAVLFCFAWPRAAAAPVPPPDRVTLTPSAPATTYFVEATYPPPPGETCQAKLKKPLRARYRGTLEVIRTGDGKLAVIDALTFPQYLSGVAEVPRSWPAEALKAQVVAARSYALYQFEHPRGQGKYLGYNICATDQCQVFRGVAVEQGPFGEAWVKAIHDTTGQALVHQGNVVQAFYFSTSSGKTKSNAEAFGGRALPYLKPVSGEDADAPLAHWTAKLPLADVTAALKLAERWKGGSIRSVSLQSDKVTVSGGGQSETMAKTTFRNALNDEAPCAFPGRYPGPGPKGRKLPLTVPSKEYSLSVSGGAVVMNGRGWGHGVGMSQFGSRSLAARGRTHKQILSHFYTGLSPRKVSEPGAIRVLAIEGASTLRIRVEGKATARAGTGSSYGSAQEFLFTGGETLGVQRGVGPTMAPVLEVKVTTPPHQTGQGHGDGNGVSTNESLYGIGYELSADARVQLIFLRGDVEVARSPVASQERGANDLAFSSSNFDSSTASSQEFAVAIEAYDGIDRVRSETFAVATAFPTPTPTPSPTVAAPDPTDEPSFPWLVAAGASSLLLLAILLLFARGRARRRSDQPNVNV